MSKTVQNKQYSLSLSLSLSLSSSLCLLSNILYLLLFSSLLLNTLHFFSLAEEAALRMVRLLGSELFTVKIVPGKSITITERVTDDNDNDNVNGNGNDNDYSDNDDDGEDLNIGVGYDEGIENSSNENFSLSGTNYRNNMLNNNHMNNGNNCHEGGNRNNMTNEDTYLATETKSEEYIDTATRFRGHDCRFQPGKKSESEKLKLLESNRNGRRKRILKLEFGNMFDVKNIQTADIVMLETDIPNELHRDLYHLLSSMKLDSRTLTYLDLRKTWSGDIYFPFRQLEINRNLSDRFPTSWSVQRGHHFYVWNKVN